MRIPVLSILLFWSVYLFSQQQIVEIHDNLEIHNLDEKMLVLVDSGCTLTIEDILAGHTPTGFQPLTDSVGKSDTPVAYWLTFRLTSAEDINHQAVIMKNPDYQNSVNRSVFTGGNEFADAYFLDGSGKMTRVSDGFLVPAKDRPLYSHPLMNRMPFTLSAGDTLTVYVRLFNQSDFTTGLSAEVRPDAIALPAEMEGLSVLMGISMGVTGILAILVFMFFLVDRDKANLFFSLLCVTLMLHYSIIHNDLWFVRWFIPNRPWLAEYVWIFFTTFGELFFLQFGRHFVNLPKVAPRIDKYVRWASWLIVLQFLLDTTLAVRHSGTDLTLASGILLVAILALCIRMAFLPGRLPKIFAVGAVWLLFFNCLGILYSAEYFQLFNPWPVGQMGLMIIYSYGLAYKLQLTERTRSDAERILELDAVKSRFFANISHEFRTPLALILGPLRKAQEQAPVSENDSATTDVDIPVSSRHLQMMRRNAERLNQLIDQLLDLSKLENGSMQLQVARADLSAFLRAIVGSFDSLAEIKQIHFQTSYPQADMKVFFDADKLEKIIVNLLSNAFKFTPERGRVSVDSTIEKGRLKIRVSDSGPGISQDEVDRIFERFYQVEGTEDTGTGIGLSLVKELVELHHGQITVESSRQGTTFKVSLPVDQENFHNTEIVAAAKTPVNRHTLHFLPDAEEPVDSIAEITDNPLPLLLIVEDNTDLRSFIAEGLEEHYRIIKAENGALGLTAALEYTPDIIISDVMMPEMDGMTLCKKLKEDEHTSHIPVILLTAKAGKENRLTGLETGADDYLTKPFDQDELRVRAGNLVAQRKKLRERFSSNHVWKPKELAVTSADERFLQKVSDIIEKQMDNEFFSVEDLADAVAFSRSQLHRKLKALVDKSPSEIIRSFRLTRAKELLEKGDGNVSEVAIKVGYGSLSYFTKSFKAEFGVLPSEI
ncbi:MAG TPA: ATP-binding protein [Chitinophagales bacterium]|nr:ATP-binding protein [Chitinophagales bacterium]